MKEAILPYAHLHFVAPIVFIEYQRDTELGFVEIRELIAVSEKLSEGMPYVVLSDVRKGISVTPMGRKEVSSAHSAPLHRGTAVVLQGKLMRTAANFFSKVSRPPYPFRAFTDRQRAIEWLLSLPL
jgi:hypothetical protein